MMSELEFVCIANGDGYQGNHVPIHPVNNVEAFLEQQERIYKTKNQVKERIEQLIITTKLLDLSKENCFLPVIDCDSDVDFLHAKKHLADEGDGYVSMSSGGSHPNGRWVLQLDPKNI